MDVPVSKTLIDSFTLHIKNPKLRELYAEKNIPYNTKFSERLAYGRFAYGLLILIRLLVEGLPLLRAYQFLGSAIVHFLMIQAQECFPPLHNFQAPVVIVTFISFIINPPETYTTEADKIAVMVGIVSVIFLSAGFISTNWIHTSTSIVFSTAVVHWYFTYMLKFDGKNLLPSQFFIVLFGSYAAYHAEKKDKMTFLQMCKVNGIQGSQFKKA